MSEDFRTEACFMRIIAADKQLKQCPACDRPDVKDKLWVKCCLCNIWYHSVCVGADESVLQKGFSCTRCLPVHSPTPSQAGKSSTSSAIQARVELALQQIQEEKQIQERLMREVEDHEKALREKAIQQELENKQKSLQQRWELERQFIGKKYNLLQSMNDGGDNVSERSASSKRSSRSTVHRWLESQKSATMAACTGNIDVPIVTTSYTGTVSKRTTATSAIISSTPVTPVNTSIPSRQAQVGNTSEAPLHDIAVGGVQAPARSKPSETVSASVPVSSVNIFPTSISNPMPAISELISPPTSTQEELAKTFSKISSDAETARRKLEQQMHDLQRQMNGLQRQSAEQLRSQQNYNQVSAEHVNSTYGKVPRQGRSDQPLVSQVSQMPLTRSSEPVLNLPPQTTHYTPRYTVTSTSGAVQFPVPSNMPLLHPRVTTIPSYPNPIPSPWVPPAVSVIPQAVPAVPPAVPVVPPEVPVVSPAVPVVPPIVPAIGPNAQQLAARHVVPKELPHFDGNPLDWPLFFSSYTNSTQMCGYTDAENLMRLQRCLKGNALNAVSYQLLHPSSVSQVVETLRTLYGRPELVVNSLLNKVRSTPPPRADKLESIISFGLVVQNLCGHLRALGMDSHLSNPTLLQELVSKLPAGVKLDWALHQQRISTVDLRAFGEFMSTIVSAASNVTFHTDFEPTRSSAVKQEKPKGKEKGFLNAHADDSDRGKAQGEQKREVNRGEKDSVQPKPCAVCQKNGHKVKECFKFQKSTIEERWKLVQQLHLCRRCLTSHGRWPCKAPVCGQNGCELKHHSLLHSEKADTPATGESSSQSTAKVNVHRQGSRSTLFRILPVRLYGKDSSIEVLAFLDDGSSFTLMEQGIADQLGIDGTIEPLCLQWTNNVTRTEAKSKVVQLEISGIRSDRRYVLEHVRTVESLGLPPQSLRFEQLEQQFPYLQGLPVNEYSGALPRILIGLDNTDLMVTLKKRMGRPLEPVATKTKLGWTVYGNIEGLDDPPEHRLLHVCSGSVDRDLHDLVEEFFSVESTGVKVAPVVETDDDRRAREIMEKTTIRTPSGRFETALLWRCDHIEFPDSRPMAERRLKCLERKLTADPELYKKVKLHIADLEAKEYIHKTTPEELASFDPRRTWFLPLGLVINPNKPGKIRLVWDAAAMVDGVSFNSMLLKGPDLLTSLKSVLHRFRQRQVAVVGDVREIFFQLFIRAGDRQSQCFLWHEDPSLPAEVYVIDVATFGSTCSPCSAQYVKNRNAEDYRAEYPEAADAIVNNHYVDDYLDSRDTAEEAIKIASEVKQVHGKAGFELRNWLSNSEEVVRRVGGSPASECKSFATDKSTGIERVLGMRWQPNTDEFTFKLCLRDDVAQLLSGDTIPTKREVLRVVMSIFDPLGLVAAYVVHGKCLVQDIWRSKIGWDQQIPEEIYVRWRQWVLAIQGLDRVTIPRCYFPGYGSDGLDNIELHVFVDASLVAFSCVAYFRIVDQGQLRIGRSEVKGEAASQILNKAEPLFITRSEAFKFAVGDTIALPCEVSSPGSYMLAWKRGIAILTAGSTKVTPDPRVRLVNGYTLQILDAQQQDAGDYICQLATINPREITHHVEILVPPKITHVTSGGHLQVRKGSPVRLECSATGNPAPNITWTRKNNVLENGEAQFTSSVYVIENMDRHKGGTYICTANNGVGQVATSQIILHVLYPPEIAVENPIVYSGEGQEAMLVCIVHGESQPEVVWHKDTMQIDQTERHVIESRGARHTLIIRKVHPQDFGNYSCIADNQLGKTRKTVTLTGKPKAAVFRSMPNSQWKDRYNISWVVDSHSPVEEFKLYYRLVDGDVLQTHDGIFMDERKSHHPYLGGNMLDYDRKITSFEPYSYNNAYNGHGMHRGTRWSKTDWRDVVLPAFPYSHHYTQGMSYLLRGLDPDQQYEARVQSRNRYGWSDFSESFLFTTSNTDTEIRDLSVTHRGGSNGSPRLLQASISSWPISIVLSVLLLVLAGIRSNISNSNNSF